MTEFINSLTEVAADYDALVLDQWGVLHDGTAPYPKALAAIEALMARGTCLVVLSNSGKRALPNRARIDEMGFPQDAFVEVMTSGEALWRDIEAARVDATRFFAIERSSGDAARWAEGLSIALVDLASADAVLLMGLPDATELSDWNDALRQIEAKRLNVYCSNPDIMSPRDGGKTVASPGALAETYRARGGSVVYYGKPHRPIFKALETTLGTTRLLMIGDSLDHDIAGAHGAGWDSVLVQGGLYSARFSQGSEDEVLAQLCKEKSVALPTYTTALLS